METAKVARMSVQSVKKRLALEALEHADTQKAITRCADCKWYFKGTVLDGKAAFKTHRRMKHV